MGRQTSGLDCREDRSGATDEGFLRYGGAISGVGDCTVRRAGTEVVPGNRHL